MGESKGKLIAFEGIDGAGKSCQIERLADTLRRDGHEVLVTREPGGTASGARIRELLLDAAEVQLDPICELLLFAADRRQHVAEVLQPALAAGQIVLCDRYVWSTVAYQGFGRGLSLNVIEELNELAVGTLLPDLTIVLDLDRTCARDRINSSRETAPDRMESEELRFFERVRAGFLTLAEQYPQSFAVIDAARSADAVFDDVLRTLGRLSL